MIKIPKHASDETRLIAARVIAVALKEDAEVDGDIEEIAADVAKHCRYGDGYQMARDLERAHWDCDMRIAEVLDGYSREIDKVHEEYLRTFAKENAIEPPLPVGAKVKTSRGTGVIDSVFVYRPLSYTVKMDGDAQAEAPTNRRSIHWFDDVEAA